MLICHIKQVYKGLLHGSTPVAIKFITRQSHKEKLRFVSEIHILKNLRHINVSLLPHQICTLKVLKVHARQRRRAKMYDVCQLAEVGLDKHAALTSS